MTHQKKYLHLLFSLSLLGPTYLWARSAEEISQGLSCGQSLHFDAFVQEASSQGMQLDFLGFQSVANSADKESILHNIGRMCTPWYDLVNYRISTENFSKMQKELCKEWTPEPTTDAIPSKIASNPMEEYCYGSGWKDEKFVKIPYQELDPGSQSQLRDRFKRALVADQNEGKSIFLDSLGISKAKAQFLVSNDHDKGDCELLQQIASDLEPSSENSTSAKIKALELLSNKAATCSGSPPLPQENLAASIQSCIDLFPNYTLKESKARKDCPLSKIGWILKNKKNSNELCGEQKVLPGGDLGIQVVSSNQEFQLLIPYGDTKGPANSPTRCLQNVSNHKVEKSFDNYGFLSELKVCEKGAKCPARPASACKKYTDWSDEHLEETLRGFQKSADTLLEDLNRNDLFIKLSCMSDALNKRKFRPSSIQKKNTAKALR